MNTIAWHRADLELAFTISMKTAKDFDKQKLFPPPFGRFELQNLEQKNTSPSRKLPGGINAHKISLLKAIPYKKYILQNA